MDSNHKFFGSKLNSVLLLVLIILMIFVLRIMVKEKEVYFGGVLKGNNKEQVKENNQEMQTYIDKTLGISFEYPKKYGEMTDLGSTLETEGYKGFYMNSGLSSMEIMYSGITKDFSRPQTDPGFDAYFPLKQNDLNKYPIITTKSGIKVYVINGGSPDWPYSMLAGDEDSIVYVLNLEKNKYNQIVLAGKESFNPDFENLIKSIKLVPLNSVDTKVSVDSKITFLKSLIVKYPNSVIKECDVNGKKYFVSDSQAFDGLAVFYSDVGVELETCGGMKPSVPPFASMCETIMPSCKIIFAGGGSGYDNVNIYNLK